MATGIQLVGLGLITAGVMMFSIPVGLVVLGIFATMVGIALERNKK
jgi:hypothetical protein